MVYVHPSRQTSHTELDPVWRWYDQMSSKVSTHHNICAVLAGLALAGHDVDLSNRYGKLGRFLIKRTSMDIDGLADC